MIPWVDRGCWHRRRALAFVRRYWDGLGVPVATYTAEPFSRAAAINTGVHDYARWSSVDVILQSDPDSFVPLDAAQEALELAAAAPGLVIPHTRYLYLSRAFTGLYLDAPFPLSPADSDCDTVGPLGVGNVVAFSVETWRLAGGYDERFGTWGSDDGAFAVACGILAGQQRRLPGDMLHLWHPRLPESEPGHPEYARALGLFREYEAVGALGPTALAQDAMRALVSSR